MKDLVRMAIYYDSVDKLIADFEQFLENNTPSIQNVAFPPHGVPRSEKELSIYIQNWGLKYQIIEVKSKLNTPLKNITVVVATNWGKIIGEI